MKLNFWQWLGILLLLGGIAVWIYEHRGVDKPAAPPITAPVVR